MSTSIPALAAEALMLPVEIVLIVLAAAVVLTGFWCGMRAFRAKLDAEAELAELGGRLLDVQESERSRIASELHDGISQELAVVALNLDDMEDRLTGSSGQRAEIMLLARRVRGIADELQQITRGLHPARLQHLGLVPSLRALAAEMGHGQVSIEVAESAWPADLPAEVALSLYRVAQEAIHNAIKHSGSGSILVSLRREHEELSLVVSDNGIGFSPRFTGSLNGLGIPSMRHRLKNIGGSLNIVSAPGQGTSVNASLSEQHRYARPRVHTGHRFDRHLEAPGIYN